MGFYPDPPPPLEAILPAHASGWMHVEGTTYWVTPWEASDDPLRGRVQRWVFCLACHHAWSEWQTGPVPIVASALMRPESCVVCPTLKAFAGPPMTKMLAENLADVVMRPGKKILWPGDGMVMCPACSGLASEPPCRLCGGCGRLEELDR